MILTRLLAALRRPPARESRERRLRELLGNGGGPERTLPALRAEHAATPLEDDLLEAYVRILLGAGERVEALDVARAAARRRPRSRASWFSLGLALLADHAYAEALETCDRALAAGALDADIHANRAIALQNLGRFDLAAAGYRHALEHTPDHPLARFHAGLLALMLGRYDEGWPLYETRLASAGVATRQHYPRWEGRDPRGRTVLVHGEQGLGDEVMFASCIPDLERAGARCVVECDPRLRALFARSFPEAAVYPAAPDQRVPAAIAALGIDAAVPGGSLPLYFRTRATDFPAHGGYLRADAERVAAWRARLDALGPGLKVGVSWKGGTHASRAPLRSIDFDRWLPILRTEGAHFISLQYTADAAATVAAMRETHGIRVSHWPEAIADYDETAALVSALDLTISVCTSIVHLAGALGRPVWVMAPVNPEWRYGHAGTTMPWYPAARIFRQREPGAWSTVIDDVATALGDLVAGSADEAARLARARALNAAGVEKLGRRDFRGAQACFEQALTAAPRLAEAHCNLGVAHVEQGAAADGERHLREAIALAPALLSARENLAVLLGQRSDYAAAGDAWRAVLDIDPQHAEAHAERAFAAMREGLIEESCVWLERAVALGADRDAELDMHRALDALSKGDFPRGWPLYEGRLRGKLESAQRPYRFPEWDGNPLRTGALLILGEQGVGDEIMFASCYADAIKRAGRCVIECEPRLGKLFARSFPAAAVFGQARESGHPDLVASGDIVAQIHAGSLPRLFRRHAEAFAAHRGYLVADAERVSAWRARLQNAGRGRWVGLAWSGGLAHTGRSRRSIPAAEFARVLDVAQIGFVSLQYDDDGSVAAELSARSGARVHVFQEALADLDDTAALIMALDSVVTVCSTVVHLAGALGVPTLVLTPARAEWRYGRRGEAMPWYPSVRLLRQRETGDWTGVIEDARAALGKNA